jgi:hypothetical protein
VGVLTAPTSLALSCRLWGIGDIFVVLKAWKTAQVGRSMGGRPWNGLARKQR